MLKLLCLLVLFFSHAVQSNPVEGKEFRGVTPSFLASLAAPPTNTNNNDISEMMDLPPSLVEEDEFVGLNPLERDSVRDSRSSFSLVFPQQYLPKLQQFMSANYGDRFPGGSLNSPRSFKRIPSVGSSSTKTAFVPWAGKRSGPLTRSGFQFQGKRFQAWAGKRGTFRNWGGKRSSDIQDEEALT